MLRVFAFFSPFIFYIAIIILGVITPGYSPIKNTISRLAVEKYGLFQQLNFLQLAFALLISGRFFAGTLKIENSKRYIRNIYNFCFLLLLIAAFFPTDKIEAASFDLSLFSPFGIIHLSIVILFIIFSPFGIYQLYKILRSEKYYYNLASFTAFMGAGAFFMSIAWIVLFINGQLSDYRGLFQKIIVLWTITWVLVINYKVFNYFESRIQKPFPKK